MRKLFTAHPSEVGETYFQHFAVAANFGLAMALGAAACLLHAAFPFLCKRTASSIIARLNHRMLVQRRAAPPS